MEILRAKAQIRVTNVILNVLLTSTFTTFGNKMSTIKFFDNLNFTSEYIWFNVNLKSKSENLPCVRFNGYLSYPIFVSNIFIRYIIETNGEFYKQVCHSIG